MKRTLAGQRVLITGASSGIGRALAVAAAAAGMRVAVTARSVDKLREVADALTAQGHEVLAEPADVTNPADRQRVLAAVAARFGGLDVLISNAGQGTQGLFVDSSAALLRQVMEVNFFAPAELLRQALPLLRAGREPAVVQIASMTAARAMPFWTEYSASKFAIRGLLQALRAEFTRFGIDVVVLLPGVTQTNLGSNLLRHDGKIAFKFEHGMTTQYVAQQTLQALRNGTAETVLGLEARWMVRVNRWLPGLVDWGLRRVVRRRHPPA